MATKKNEVIDALERAIRADAEWDHDFTPSPHDPYYVADKLAATPANLTQLREAADDPKCGAYARRALEKLAEAAHLDHDDESKDEIDIAEGRAYRARQVLENPTADLEARADAVVTLTELHHAADATQVLEYFIGERKVPPALSTVAWLAPHPRSDVLLGFDPPLMVVCEIVRRRRCAGMSTGVDGLHDRVLAVRAGSTESKEPFAVEWNARLAVELGLDADASHQPPLDVSDADVRFLEGFIETGATVALVSAYAIYAELLRRDPAHRHAAFQLAWIDRAFGSPMTEDRIAWLRSIGVWGWMLNELVEAPPEVVPGPRLAKQPLSSSRRFAERAWAAGLPSIAALYYRGGGWGRQLAATRAQAAAHIDRFWR